jgi:Flp pilus assembly pilin Flp
MRKLWDKFSNADRGQDVVEYTLLLAFVVLMSAALLVLGGTRTQGIWGLTNTHLNRGMQSASN